MQRPAREPPPGCPPDSIVLWFPVPRELAGLRLDRFIQTRIPRVSRTRANEIVRACAYRADGRRRRPSERVRKSLKPGIRRARSDMAKRTKRTSAARIRRPSVGERVPLRAVATTKMMMKGAINERVRVSPSAAPSPKEFDPDR